MEKPRNRYQFDRMAVGDKVDFPIDEGDRARKAAYAYAARHNKKFFTYLDKERNRIVVERYS